MLGFRAWRRTGTWLALATVLSGMLGLPPARAQDAPPEAIRLEWSAPTGCPGAAEVRARVDRLLGGTPASSARREIARAVVSSGSDGRLRLEVTTETAGTKGRRELSAASCRELADAAALIVALAFDPDAVARTREAPPTPPIATTPVVTAPAVVTGSFPAPAALDTTATAPPPLETRAPGAPAPEARAAPVATPGAERPTWRPASPPSRDEIDVTASALVSSGIGAMPEPALGFTASLGLVNRLGRVELAGTYWLEQHGSVAGRPSIGGDFSFVSGSASLCPTLVRGEFEIAGCGGLELGRMHAEGTGVRDPGDNTLVWVAARAGGIGTWRLDPRFGMRLDLGAAIPFVRPRWVLGTPEATEVDRPGPVDARAGLGGEVRF